MLRSSVSHIRLPSRWTPSSVQSRCFSFSSRPVLSRSSTITNLSFHYRLPQQSRNMCLNTRVGFRLYELDGGLVSRQFRLQVAVVSRPRVQLPPNRHFHSSPPNRAWPILGVILGALKVNCSIDLSPFSL